MSGGVDSSVAALLLKEQGYDVIGGTFKLYKYGCSGAENDDVADAARVCADLGIPHYVFDFEDIFKEKVVDKFVRDYENGETPNPCVDCNKHIKFGKFLECADELGAAYVCTGHYGNVLQNPVTKRFELHRAAADLKDQSYVLYSLSQNALSRLLLPLSELDKEQVRAIAKKAGLQIFSKPDSQDVCFIPNGSCGDFLRDYTGRDCKQGSFVDIAGKPIAPHKGIWNYTIGQRKGLGVAVGKPAFVSKIDPQTGDITLADEEYLFSAELIAADINLIEVKQLLEPMRLDAKIRYSAKARPATVYPLKDGKLRIVFDTAQRAITKGQAVVLYNGSSVFGGGTISG